MNIRSALAAPFRLPLFDLMAAVAVAIIAFLPPDSRLYGDASIDITPVSSIFTRTFPSLMQTFIFSDLQIALMASKIFIFIH